MIRVTYTNRLLGMRHAAADPVIDGWGDMSEASLGYVALANARTGDKLPDGETVVSITEKTLTIRGTDGQSRRLRVNSDKLDRFARDCGELILLRHINSIAERLGDLLVMLSRDPAYAQRDWAVMLIDSQPTGAVKA